MTQDHIIVLRTNSVTYKRRGGLRKVQMTVTPIMFLSSKGYGNPRVSVFLFKELLHVVH
jgi:hypothetical protein